MGGVLTMIRQENPRAVTLSHGQNHSILSLMPSLYTIGYEQASLHDVIAALKAAKIKLLIDTRAVAASRRAGFSKKMLAASLEAAGIAYLHLQKLGTPAEGRAAARAGDFKKLWKVYGKHLRTREAKAALDELETILQKSKGVCLLCYEREPAECHRSKIAEIMHERTGQKIENLYAVPV
jgi:uncharacterized protein (DUF488 family)